MKRDSDKIGYAGREQAAQPASSGPVIDRGAYLLEQMIISEIMIRTKKITALKKQVAKLQKRLEVAKLKV